ASLAQLGDAQFDRAGAGLPGPVAVAVALRQALGALLAIGRSGQPGDLHFHQPLGGKADHLAQQIGIWGLLHERAKVHHLVGHRWFLESGWCQQPDPTDESPVTTAKPSTRYGAIGERAGGRLCSTELHHHWGHDPLDLKDRNDPITQLVAKKIIEVHQTGVRDPTEISKIAIEQLLANYRVL